jgi:NADH:ubiquinone oxidoreductase subunit 6 (subunit J)
MDVSLLLLSLAVSGLVAAAFVSHWARIVLLGAALLYFGRGVVLMLVAVYTDVIAPADPAQGVEPLSPLAVAFGLLFYTALFGAVAYYAWRFYRVHKAEGTLIRPWNAR